MGNGPLNTLVRSVRGQRVSKKDEQEFYSVIKDVLRYAVVMGVMALVIIALLESDIDQKPLNTIVAYNSNFFLTAMGYDASTTEDTKYGAPILSFPCDSTGGYRECRGKTCTFNAIITNECNGYIGYIIVLGFVLAVPRIKPKQRLKGLFMGVTAVFWANSLRLTSIAMMMNDISCNMFDTLHLYIWREGMIIWVLLFWALWLRSLK